MILRQIDSSKKYDKVIPAIQININGKDTFGRNEFIYKSMMIEVNHKIIRDELLTIYDINLDFLRNIDYTKIKKENIFSLEKILYIFICDNKKLLDYIYQGDKVMDKVRDNFDTYRNDVDDILYYNLEEYNRMLDEEELDSARKKAREEGHKEGIEQGRIEGIEQGTKDTLIKTALNLKNILKNMNINLEQISEATGLTIDEINNL